MKKGDKVRFLNDVGGGTVAGFQDKNIVLVEDEDGFQIPTLLKDLVVVEADNYDTAKVRTSDSDARAQNEISVKEEETEPSDREITYRKKAEERKDGNKLSAYLAFVPQNLKNVTNTKFDIYLVNDSNYYLSYTILRAENVSWSLFSQGEIEPNTKFFINELDRSQLNDWGRVSVSMIAFKRDRNFILKPSFDVQIRIDSVKFYKLHTFKDNIFFEQPALLYTIIENDKIVHSLALDAQQLKSEMYKSSEKRNNVSAKGRHCGLVRRYDVSQSKSRNLKQSAENTDTIVVDLHADAVLDTTAGMSSTDILNYQLDVFRRTLEENKKNKGFKIIFIHGKGNGVLRHAIIHELSYKYKQFPHQDASFQEFGYGATQVTIR